MDPGAVVGAVGWGKGADASAGSKWSGSCSTSEHTKQTHRDKWRGSEGVRVEGTHTHTHTHTHTQTDTHTHTSVAAAFFHEGEGLCLDASEVVDARLAAVPLPVLLLAFAVWTEVAGANGGLSCNQPLLPVDQGRRVCVCVCECVRVSV